VTRESPPAAAERDDAQPRRRGPYSSTPARRAEIVRAASASFAEHGYERASLRDIAARAGITHAALLRHFAGKEELLLAALAQREADDAELATRIVESRMPAESILSALLREEFAHPEHQRNWLAISIAATKPDHPAHDYFMRRRERMSGRFSSSSLQTARGSAHLSADEKVTLVLAMTDGLRIQALLDPTIDALGLLEVFMKLVISPSDDETAD
jgi:AcrR family transcriptional regulator